MLFGAFIVAGAHADILLDNISGGTGASSILASQDFEAINNSVDVAALEKFTTTASAYQITSVSAGLAKFNTTTPNDFSGITGWRVEIYSGVTAAGASLTGDVKSLTFTPAQMSFTSISSGGKLASFTLSEILAPNTTYWIGVIPVMNFTGNGQIGIIQGSVDDAVSWQANPGGGFAHPGNVARVPRDLAYRVEATGVVPEPASMVALGLGLAAVVRRRRKV